MIKIPFNPDPKEPLSWRPSKRDGVWFPQFTCKCGARGCLTDWTIDNIGNVSPSVDCLGDSLKNGNGCNFHDYIQLENYSEAMNSYKNPNGDRTLFHKDPMVLP